MRSCGRGYGRGRGFALGAMGGRWALGRRMGALPFACHPRGSALSPAVPVIPSRGRRRPVTLLCQRPVSCSVPLTCPAL